MQVDLGDAPMGTLDMAVEKALAVFTLLEDQGWHPLGVHFVFNGTPGTVKPGDTPMEVIARWADSRSIIQALPQH